MAELLVVNNAISTLVNAILAGDVACTVQPGDAAKFPAPAAGQLFKATIENKNTGAFEIVHCTARVAGVLTIVRAQETTAAQGFPAGSIISCRSTKELLERLYQPVRPSPQVASAADITVDPLYGYCQITGVANINRISTANRNGGSRLTLKFNGALTVNHNVAAGGGFAGIFLSAGVNLARGIGQTLRLVYDEVDNKFYQE